MTVIPKIAIISAMVKEYWQAIHRCAFKETRHALRIETGERTIIAVIITSLSLALLWVSGAHDVTYQELIGKFTFTTAILFVFPLIYIWKLITIPARKDAEFNTALNSFQIKQASIDKLAILHNEGNEVVFGRPSVSQAEIPEWISRCETWCEQVSAILKQEFSIADQLSFLNASSLVGHIYNVGFGTHDYATTYKARIDRLQAIIDMKKQGMTA